MTSMCAPRTPTYSTRCGRPRYRRYQHYLTPAATIAEAGSYPTEAGPVRIQKHTWNISPATLQHIEHIQHQWRAFRPLDNQVVAIPRLRLDALRAGRAPPNVAAHLTALLALHLVDGEGSLGPEWENASLGGFARGRIEWVQTVSEDTQDFIVEAATTTVAALDGGESNSIMAHRGKAARLRTLFDCAAASYARALIDADRGYGVVGPMYALLLAATDTQGWPVKAAATIKEGHLPALFRSRAWAATRRGGPGQDIKLGFARFMPDDFDAAGARVRTSTRTRAGS
ncbi:hypothetical protein VTI74DRAFT_4839 [Chaetomium olivicolor]